MMAPGMYAVGMPAVGVPVMGMPAEGGSYPNPLMSVGEVSVGPMWPLSPGRRHPSAVSAEPPVRITTTPRTTKGEEDLPAPDKHDK